MATQLAICNLALDHIGQNPITQAELTAATIKPARLCDAHWDLVLDEVLDVHPWNFVKKHWPLEYVDLYSAYNDDEITITGISQADPGVVTSVGHGYLTDYLVKIEDVVGMTELNERVFEITKADADTFSLNGIDTSIYTAYTSGGTAVRMEALAKYQPDGYTYKIPSDLLRPLALDGGGEFELIGGGGATNNIKRILTTVEDAVLIGISNRTTVAELTNRFIKVLAARLAAEIAFSMTGKERIERSMWALYNFHLSDSGVKDSRESNVKPDTTDSWLQDAGYE
jgi:hypothetical protein